MRKKMCRFTRMKRILLFLILAWSSFVFLSSCSKGGSSTTDTTGGGIHGNSSPVDTTAPVLEVYTPAANQVFTSGSNINITGKITDDLGLYRGYIRITDDANGNVLKDQQYEIHYVLS